MINFEEELKKYKPVLEVDDLSEGVGVNDVKDILELLQYLSTTASTTASSVADAAAKAAATSAAAATAKAVAMVKVTAPEEDGKD